MSPEREKAVAHLIRKAEMCQGQADGMMEKAKKDPKTREMVIALLARRTAYKGGADDLRRGEHWND